MLYTRKGDKGDTGLFGCDQRMSKSSPIAEALGTLDELNSYIGLIRADIRGRSAFSVPVGKQKKSAEVLLEDMQQTLFIIQAEMAGAEKKVGKGKVSGLERITDTIENDIPPIHAFSLSGSTYLSALFDVARTIVRRAERRVVEVSEEGVVKVGKNTLAYMNRLSSAMFALARYANHVEEVKEINPDYA
jgi:cob(I)alamin adenosyltransferase